MKKNYFISLIAMLFICLCANAQAVLTFSNVSLEPGSKIESIKENQQITFNTNMDAEIGFMTVGITDETGKVIFSLGTVYNPDNRDPWTGEVTDLPVNKKEPHFTWTAPVTFTFTEGHTYTLTFKAYANSESSAGEGAALAEGTISYEGATPAYVGSQIEVLSVTPDPETYVIKSIDGAAVTVTFSGKVRLNMEGTFVNEGQGATSSYASIEPGEDAETIDEVVYSSSWTVTPSQRVIEDGASIFYCLDAFDKDGYHVTKGACISGEDETAFISVEMSNNVNRPVFNITPAVDNQYVNSLYSFVVSADEEGIAAANIAQPAVLFKVGEDGQRDSVTVITTIIDDKIQPGDPSSYKDEVTLSQRLFLDKQITAAGKYILYFPSAYFNFGTGMMAKQSGEVEFEYTLKEDFVAPAVKVMGETTVKKLSKIEIQYPDYDEVAPNPDETVNGYILNENNELVTKVALEACWDYIEYANVIDCNVKTPIVTPGKYKLIIPENAIIASTESGDDWEDFRNAKGGYNPEEGDDFQPEYTLLGAYVQEFTVEAGDVNDVTVKMDLADGSTINKPFEALTLTFESASGADVVVEVMGWDTDAWWRGETNFVSESTCEGNTVVVTPYTGGRKKEYGITENGTYTVTFPEGFFQVNGVDWPEIKITFTVDIPVGIDAVANGKAEVKSAYTLSGAKIATASAINGTYIINGKKVVK